MELNDDFLAEIGLGDLPKEQRKPFLEQVYSTLEQRTGEALSAGLTDAQLAEFESLVNRDGPKVAAWLEKYAPDFATDPLYLKVRDAMGPEASDSDVVCEYAAGQWLHINRPNHKEVVTQIFADIKGEIIANRDKILGIG
ncbi:DUF5663 domain-containing protein [Gordonia alkaliphila]|uniref:Uncharacterized protein n=1 Tax=Gordonia alkaliphila TaxID=1053547 RepID=A0ABP8Z1L1_9ACTN